MKFVSVYFGVHKTVRLLFTCLACYVCLFRKDVLLVYVVRVCVCVSASKYRKKRTCFYETPFILLYVRVYFCFGHVGVNILVQFCKFSPGFVIVHMYDCLVYMFVYVSKAIVYLFKWIRYRIGKEQKLKEKAFDKLKGQEL